MLGVDRQPTPWAKVEDVAVMEVAVQHDNVLGLVQQLARRDGSQAQETTVPCGSRFKLGEPLRQRHE